MAEERSSNIFGRIASTVDTFFEEKFYKIGFFVGTRPFVSIALSLVFIFACAAGISQVNQENRSDKLWIPQGTRAQDDEAAYTAHFKSQTRIASVMLEAKEGSAVDKAFLIEAMTLHEEVEAVEFKDDKGIVHNLSNLCVRGGFGGSCLISSLLNDWNFNKDTLNADSTLLQTVKSNNRSQSDYERLLGGATFNGNDLIGAKTLLITYIMKSNEILEGNSYIDPQGEGWEGNLLEVLGCDKPDCDGDYCACGYKSDKFRVFASATRSFNDAFGAVISGDIGLVNGAFLIMLVYLTLNLGGLCHKINSRALLAVGCMVTIVFAGLAGHGLAMWMQFIYTPIHSVLPFVLIGIGVDDSFVIMNAFDQTDPSKDVPERIATAISKAGVSIMVTSITDFVAFSISVSSALPALQAFCMYAALCILFLFFFQITIFGACVTLDAHRVVGHKIDCCVCLTNKLPACFSVVDKADAAKAVEEGRKDPNQMLCCTESKHTGGRTGVFLENYLAPQLVKLPVSIVVVVFFIALCGISVWQATLLSVQDTTRSFLPDDSYVLSTLEKQDYYFADLGVGFNIMTTTGDYFASQSALVDIGARLDKLDFVLPSTGDSFDNWAVEYKSACESGNSALTGGVVVNVNADGFATNRTEYYTGLKGWLSSAGSKYQKDVKWVDETNPQNGIKVARVSAEAKSALVRDGDKVLNDASYAVKAMDGIRAAVDSWSDMPGGTPIAYTRLFTGWETFKVIGREMYLSVGLCLVAVFFVILVFIGHPLTASLVTICVVMAIVDILGFMQVWGLAIDSVTVIQLVISVGLTVDYAAHVAHNFMTQVGSRSERVVKTMGDVGAAVLSGATSTFLGVMLLAASQSYVFRVLFQCFFLTAVLGVAHGMILLPVLLNLIGPASCRGAPAENEAVKVPEAMGSATEAPVLLKLGGASAENGIVVKVQPEAVGNALGA